MKGMFISFEGIESTEESFEPDAYFPEAAFFQKLRFFLSY